MTRFTRFSLATALISFCLACSTADKEHAHEQAEEAKQKTREETARAEQEARRLGAEAKADAKSLDANINRALQGSSGSNGGSQPEQKLARAGQELKDAGSRASVKLDQAAVIAKVKAKLVTDAGLSTAANIKVDCSGSVVTLTGTVASEQAKQQVQQSAAAVDGVTKVINRLTVQP